MARVLVLEQPRGHRPCDLVEPLAYVPAVPVPAAVSHSLSTALVLGLRRVLVIKCFRSDRLLQAFSTFVNLVFDRDLLGETIYDLGDMVSSEVDASSPVCLASVAGYDASYRVDNLVALTKARCVSIAMGSQEGFALADQAIAAAARTGNWVLLKNVHLAPSWLSQLEKRLQSLNPNRSFRLFLTMETNPSIPVNILRQGRVLMNEPPPGIRANILESLRTISPARLASGPAEKTRLYFLLAWFHAVVQERLRYVPLGWSKVYEFNDSDQEAALAIIDSWLAGASKGRSNVDPAAIPWDAIRSLLRESVYGGKVDTEFDQNVLDSFVAYLFSPQAYDVDFALVRPSDGDAGLTMPDATRLDQFVAWTKKLPEQEPPSYLSLPPSAERVIAVAQGTRLLSRLLKMRSQDDNETVAQDVKKDSASTIPAWMRALQKSCNEWLEILPKVSLQSSQPRLVTDHILRRRPRSWRRASTASSRPSSASTRENAPSPPTSSRRSPRTSSPSSPSVPVPSSRRTTCAPSSPTSREVSSPLPGFATSVAPSPLGHGSSTSPRGSSSSRGSSRVELCVLRPSSLDSCSTPTATSRRRGRRWRMRRVSRWSS
jgi:dynein heavy chain 1